MDKTRIIPKQAHADLKEMSENKQLLMLNKENSLLLGDSEHPHSPGDNLNPRHYSST